MDKYKVVSDILAMIDWTKEQNFTRDYSIGLIEGLETAIHIIRKNQGDDNNENESNES